ncbi:MAG: hypothetical protein IPN18_05310 [Ignavibacteriales bacterium]|nr:hypothetical protein [Ignavibacteriales bacterium]
MVDKLNFNGITTIDIGVELSNHLSNKTDITFLSIESQDFISNLVQNSISKTDQSNLKIIVFYNFGILLDPVLKHISFYLVVVQILLIGTFFFKLSTKILLTELYESECRKNYLTYNFMKLKKCFQERCYG